MEPFPDVARLYSADQPAARATTWTVVQHERPADLSAEWPESTPSVTGCGGAVAGVHSKCDRQGGTPWLALGILAPLAGLFDHLEEGLCWCGMDDDHAEAVTRVPRASR